MKGVTRKENDAVVERCKRREACCGCIPAIGNPAIVKSQFSSCETPRTVMKVVDARDAPIVGFCIPSVTVGREEALIGVCGELPLDLAHRKPGEAQFAPHKGQEAMQPFVE